MRWVDNGVGDVRDGLLKCRDMDLEKGRVRALFLELWTRSCDFLFLPTLVIGKKCQLFDNSAWLLQT